MNSKAADDLSHLKNIHRAAYVVLAVGVVTMVVATYFFYVPPWRKLSGGIISPVFRTILTFVIFPIQYGVVRRFSNNRRASIAILLFLVILVGTSAVLFFRTLFDPVRKYHYVYDKLFGLTEGEHFISGWVFWSWILTGLMFVVAKVVDPKRSEET